MEGDDAVKRILFLVSILAVGLMLCSSANATLIQLSNASSDETPAQWLAAALYFSVADQTLNLSVTNQTGGFKTPEAVPELTYYNISEIYFNASADVNKLTLTALPGWTLYTSATKNSTKVGGFGTFDYAIKASGKDYYIKPGDSPLVFSFAIAGIDTFSESDFIDEWTYDKDGNRIALVAAKFVMGPTWNPVDDSAFGALAAVPEPATMLLLGFGLIGLTAFGGKRFLKGA
jgi:hypothetical protein